MRDATATLVELRVARDSNAAAGESRIHLCSRVAEYEPFLKDDPEISAVARRPEQVVGQVFAGSGAFVVQMSKQLRSYDRTEQKGVRELKYCERGWTQFVKAIERVWKEP